MGGGGLAGGRRALLRHLSPRRLQASSNSLSSPERGHLARLERAGGIPLGVRPLASLQGWQVLFAGLLNTHQDLDQAVDRCYRPELSPVTGTGWNTSLPSATSSPHRSSPPRSRPTAKAAGGTQPQYLGRFIRQSQRLDIRMILADSDPMKSAWATGEAFKTSAARAAGGQDGGRGGTAGETSEHGIRSP